MNKRKQPDFKNEQKTWSGPSQKKIEEWWINISEHLSIFSHRGSAYHGHSGQDGADARGEQSRMLAEQRRGRSLVLLAAKRNATILLQNRLLEIQWCCYRGTRHLLVGVSLRERKMPVCQMAVWGSLIRNSPELKRAKMGLSRRTEKQWDVYAVGYDTAAKKNEPLKRGTSWMVLFC